MLSKVLTAIPFLGNGVGGRMATASHYSNILVESGIPLKLVRLLKICLSGTYVIVRGGKHLSDMVPSKNGLKRGDFYFHFFFNLSLNFVHRVSSI